MKALGPEVLRDDELVAVLLGSATRRHSVFQVARDLVAGPGGLESLARWSRSQLAAQGGVGEVGSCRLVAAVELCRRLARVRTPVGLPVVTAAEVFDLMRGRFVGENRERVEVLLLDARRQLLGHRVVSVGSLVSSVVHPREVFRPAVEAAAAAIVLVHNHPSGDPSPSVEDHHVTQRISDAGLLLGIRLLDHVIVASTGFCSFREEGWMTSM